MARTAVEIGNRERLYDRTKTLLETNYPVMDEWIKSFGDFFTYQPPEAGAFCFVKYNSDKPSYEICQDILHNQSTLIVPGIHFKLEGFLRIWMGGKPGFMQEGLRRIGIEISKLKRK